MQKKGIVLLIKDKKKKFIIFDEAVERRIARTRVLASRFRPRATLL
jgi:hypothetical protein